MAFILNMREVLYALSEALDYVGIDDIMHGKRVAYMSSEIAKKLNWDNTDIDDVIAAGMLHDCGVSSTDVHIWLVNELDWGNSHVHCKRGYELLEKSCEFRPYSSMILYHHTHWDEFPMEVSGKTRDFANLIYLSDRIDSLRVQLGCTTEIQKNAIRSTIEKYSKTMFAPHFVETFLEISFSDSFWYNMEDDAVHEYFMRWMEEGEHSEIGMDRLYNIAEMFADIVDAKSTFTYKHTRGVVALAIHLARLYGLSEEQREIIGLAGYFHDLGKLRVSDAILYKPGGLTDEERSQMNRHGFDSYMILRKIKGFEQIAKFASMHHEMLDANGYPYHYAADHIPIEVRILTIADIFQALIQDRPYRNGLTMHESYEILLQMSDEGKIDRTVLALLGDDLETCYIHAMDA